jgi:hypothetical protein
MGRDDGGQAFIPSHQGRGMIRRPFISALKNGAFSHVLVDTRWGLSNPSIIVPVWLTEWMKVHQVTLWGAADLREFPTPRDETGQKFIYAVSWAIPMNPQIMATI